MKIKSNISCRNVKGILLSIEKESNSRFDKYTITIENRTCLSTYILRNVTLDEINILE